ncbi:contact-dependent growth inhibition system immunity protein [Ancylobacter terrae]|uniref:contact-dependent growth inhibition system immunity protein n=1 Tax=Ancylobacter sp. sgz301288 TaxID=3342077 RepID=UPI0038587345
MSRWKNKSPRPDHERSLEELDGERWGAPLFDSYVVTTCHSMRKKPLVTLTDEELRLVIGQGFSLEWLVPVALERLKQDPLRAGDFHDGDLLANVLAIPAAWWETRAAETQALKAALSRALDDERLIDRSAEWSPDHRDPPDERLIRLGHQVRSVAARLGVTG